MSVDSLHQIAPVELFEQSPPPFETPNEGIDVKTTETAEYLEFVDESISEGNAIERECNRLFKEELMKHALLIQGIQETRVDLVNVNSTLRSMKQRYDMMSEGIAVEQATLSGLESNHQIATRQKDTAFVEFTDLSRQYMELKQKEDQLANFPTDSNEYNQLQTEIYMENGIDPHTQMPSGESVESKKTRAERTYHSAGMQIRVLDKQIADQQLLIRESEGDRQRLLDEIESALEKRQGIIDELQTLIDRVKDSSLKDWLKGIPDRRQLLSLKLPGVMVDNEISE